MVRGMDEHSGTTAPHFSQIDRLGQTVILSLEPLRAGGLRAHSFRKTDSRMLRTDAPSLQRAELTVECGVAALQAAEV